MRSVTTTGDGCGGTEVRLDHCWIASPVHTLLAMQTLCPPLPHLCVKALAFVI